MGKFGRALAGGIAGMAGAAEEVFDDKIKNKEYDRRDEILIKREKTLASFRHGLTMDRDQSRDAQASLVRDENRAYKEDDQQSGKMLDGMPLTKQQLSRLSDEDLGRTISVGAYKEGEDARQFGEKKEIAQMGIDAQNARSAQTDARLENRYRTKATKPMTPAEIKVKKENAINDLKAGIGSLGGMYLKEDNLIEIPINEKNRAKVEAVKDLAKTKGFNPTASEVDGFLTINLGSFDPARIGKSIAAPVVPIDKAEPGSSTAEENLANLRATLSKGNAPTKLVSSHADRSKVNTEQPVVTPEAIAAPSYSGPSADTQKIIQQYKQATGQDIAGKSAEEIARVVGMSVQEIKNTFKGLSDIDYSKVQATPNYLK